MEARECIKGRRSIRKYSDKPVDKALIEEIVETASYAPSWKHSQTIRYIAVTGELKHKLATECFTSFPGNGAIIDQAPWVILMTGIKGRSGLERDGSPTNRRGATWQMYDAGCAGEAFCLAAYEKGLGTVIMGIFDEDSIVKLLDIPDDRELIAITPLGYPDDAPLAPKRKAVEELLEFK